MSHLLQGLCVGLLPPICDRPSVSVPEFYAYLPGSIVTFCEWEDSSAGPTLICVAVFVVVIVAVVLCVCWLYMWVRAKVGRDKRFYKAPLHR